VKTFVDLKNRFIVSTISVVVTGALIVFSLNPIVQFLITVLIAGLAIVGIWEYVHLLKTKKIVIPFWLLSSLAALFVFANYLAILNIGFSALTGVAIVAFFFAILLYNFSKIEGAITNIATCFFGAFYIVFPLGLMLRILYPVTIPSGFIDGRIWLAYLIIVTKITDVGAYFIGKLWGKSKLAPHLSPGKTMIGAVAGFAAALIASLCFCLISNVSSPTIFHLSIIEAIVLGGLIGIFSQLGDLAESLLKRDAQVKDSNTIPGIGGVLDLVDSLLFTIPILYLFLKTTHL
jgi:phosphatidate cytidylyltransferase